MDRYAYSGVAYSAAKPNLSLDWCKQCDLGLPKPDLVCFMDTELASMSDRAAFGEERYEKSDFQALVYANFKKLFGLDEHMPLTDCSNLETNSISDGLLVLV